MEAFTSAKFFFPFYFFPPFFLSFLSFFRYKLVQVEPGLFLSLCNQISSIVGHHLSFFASFNFCTLKCWINCHWKQKIESLQGCCFHRTVGLVILVFHYSYITSKIHANEVQNWEVVTIYIRFWFMTHLLLPLLALCVNYYILFL